MSPIILTSQFIFLSASPLSFILAYPRMNMNMGTFHLLLRSPCHWASVWLQYCDLDQLPFL